MTFVGACAAAHAYIHEDLERPILVEQVLEPVVDDLLPVIWQLPIFVQGVPGPRVRKAQCLDAFGIGCVAVHSLADVHRDVHPVVPFGRPMIYVGK